MAGVTPNLVTCCDPCEDSPSVQVPGPAGTNGVDGTNGANGQSAFTTFTVDFTIPAELGSAVATVGSSSWLAVNMIVYAAKTDGSVRGFFQVTAIGGATSITLKNLEDAATAAYPDNSAPGSILTIGSKICAAGPQGPSGAVTGTAGGDLKGTYPNPKLLLANAKGSIPVGNGTDTTAVVVGSNGQLLAADSAQPNGVVYTTAIPVAGTDNALLRLNGTTGKPIPLQEGAIVLTDNGALQTTYGNAKGADAVDLQASHSAVTQVAGGQESVIVGGRQNTAAGVRASILGGDANTASAQESTVGGGRSNQATDERATVGGGDGNIASAQEATIAGGNLNAAAGVQSTIGGGDGNSINSSGTESTIAGGHTNAITAARASIGGGENNLVSANLGTIGGGNINRATAVGSVIPGGTGALADKAGQMAHAAGSFVNPGDAQASSILMRNSTPDATPVSLYTDGSLTLCVVPVGASWMFQIKLVARKDDGLTSIYKAEGLITNVGGVVSMPAAAVVTEIYDGISLPATPVAVTADNVNDCLQIQVTGVAATNIRWVAEVQTVEVTY